MDIANRQVTLYYDGVGMQSTSSVETSQFVRPPPSPKYEASEGEKGEEPGRDCASPSSFDSARFSQQDTTHKRSHKHAIWWLPEILSQIGGILCLAGKVFGLIIVAHDTGAYLCFSRQQFAWYSGRRMESPLKPYISA